MKTLKEKVLAKCKELHNPAAPWINEEWDLKRYATKNLWELHRHKGACDIRYKFDDATTENDEVWPLAAQVLGVGVEMNFTDALNIFAMAKKAYKMGVENATLAGIDHDKTIEAWFKKQIGI